MWQAHWSFGDGFARIVVTFGIDDSFIIIIMIIVLSEGPTYDTIDSVGKAEVKSSINFCKTNTKFSFNIHCNGD